MQPRAHPRSWRGEICNSLKSSTSPPCTSGTCTDLAPRTLRTQRFRFVTLCTESEEERWYCVSLLLRGLNKLNDIAFQR